MPPLLCAAAGIGDKEAIIAMVSDGGVAMLRAARDYDGRTPLHLAGLSLPPSLSLTLCVCVCVGVCVCVCV